MTKLKFYVENGVCVLLVLNLLYFLYMIELTNSTVGSLFVNLLTQLWLFTFCYVLNWNKNRAILQTLLLTISICLLNILKINYLDAALLPYDIHFIDMDNIYIFSEYKLLFLSILLLFVSLFISLPYIIIDIYKRKQIITFKKLKFFLLCLSLSIFSFILEMKIYKNESCNLTHGIKQGLGMYLFLCSPRQENPLDYYPKNQSGLFAKFLSNPNDQPSVSFPAVQKPDIFLWLHESTVNPDIYCKFNSFEKLSLFSADRYTQEQGWLRVHVFGGGTWLSEFSVLTGINHLDFNREGFSVFYSVVPKLNDSLVKALKNQGYYTIAFNPLKIKNHYNAENAYYHLGFDEVINPHDLNFPNLWKIPDAIVVNSLIKIWQMKRKINRPLFIYGLTIAQHAPYDSNKKSRIPIKNNRLDNNIINARMTDYWDRISILSKNYQVLQTALLEQNKRKVVLVSFGDHHPSFWQQDTAVTNNSFCSPNLSQPNYVTYYKIQDNFTRQTKNEVNLFSTSQVLDISFLPSKILTISGLKKNAVFAANQRMSELCSGKLNDCPNQQLVASYKSYLYHILHIFSP
ncbi:MAG: sulfatase-like hydrolase/transferase [Pseudomonadota bacterium]